MRFKLPDTRESFINMHVNMLIAKGITADTAREILIGVWELCDDVYESGYSDGVNRYSGLDDDEDELYEEDIETLGMSEQELVIL